MKTPKLMTAFIAILLFSNFLYAVKPLTGNVTDFENIKLMQLSRYINLTDSQKVLVKAKANEYGMKILNKDSITYKASLPLARQEYNTAIDDILTNEQKALIDKKRNERRNAAISKYNNNNK
jgi:hypothetical protein